MENFGLENVCILSYINFFACLYEHHFSMQIQNSCTQLFLSSLIPKMVNFIKSFTYFKKGEKIIFK